VAQLSSRRLDATTSTGKFLENFLRREAVKFDRLVPRSLAANQIVPRELQIDFDCAESKLDGYQVWVEAIKYKISPVPVTITALPSWLNPNSEVGRDGALRRLRRRAQRQATERMLPRVILCTICSARSARAGTAQRSCLAGRVLLHWCQTKRCVHQPTLP
jgi:hypothetical protein